MPPIITHQEYTDLREGDVIVLNGIFMGEGAEFVVAVPPIRLDEEDGTGTCLLCRQSQCSIFRRVRVYKPGFKSIFSDYFYADEIAGVIKLGGELLWFNIWEKT